MSSPPPALIEAVVTLPLEPRTQAWTSLSYCVLDAVWSIGANYKAVVVPLVRKAASDFGDDEPVASPDAMPDDPIPLTAFLSRYPSESDLRAVVNNKQLTSTRGGITKAEAVLRYAQILHAHGIDDLPAAADLLEQPEKLEVVERGLRKVPGEGTAGVRRGYLWMLVGDDQRIKPDRMVLRWLQRHGFKSGAEQARDLITEISQHLTSPNRLVTPWMIDHAIWSAERARGR